MLWPETAPPGRIRFIHVQRQYTRGRPPGHRSAPLLDEVARRFQGGLRGSTDREQEVLRLDLVAG